MEADNQISDVLSKLFSGQIQFNIQNSLVTMKRLSESLEYGVSIEMIHGPGLSFHTRIFESLLQNNTGVDLKFEVFLGCSYYDRFRVIIIFGYWINHDINPFILYDSKKVVMQHYQKEQKCLKYEITIG